MKKGWFKIPGVQDGDRTIEEQMKGLGPLLAEVAGKTVIDFGCAEGLVCRELLTAGAAACEGVDSVPASIKTARATTEGCAFYVADLNSIDRQEIESATPKMKDIALALAILHKLQRPADMVRYLAKITRSLIVIRLPAKTPGYIDDARSGFRRVYIHTELGREWILEREERGHLDEWIGYYRRAR